MSIIEKLKNKKYKVYQCSKCKDDEPCIVFIDGEKPNKCVIGLKKRLSMEDESKWAEIKTLLDTED